MFDGCPRNVPFVRLLQLHNILLRALHHSSLSRANSAMKSFSLLHTRLPNATRNVKKKRKELWKWIGFRFSQSRFNPRLDSIWSWRRCRHFCSSNTSRSVSFFLSCLTIYCVQVGFSFVPFFRTNTHTRTDIDTHTHRHMHVWLNSLETIFVFSFQPSWLFRKTFNFARRSDGHGA